MFVAYCLAVTKGYTRNLEFCFLRLHLSPILASDAHEKRAMRCTTVLAGEMSQGYTV